MTLSDIFFLLFAFLGTCLLLMNVVPSFKIPDKTKRERCNMGMGATMAFALVASGVTSPRRSF